MDDRTKIDILREEIKIPQIVQQKADAAYGMIRGENNKPGMMLSEGKEKSGLHKMSRKKLLPLAAAAVTLTGGLSVAAGVRWNPALSEKWQVEESQKERLQKEGAAAFAMQSQTQNGVTITAQQSITDNYSVYMGFKVEGYMPGENLSPGFEEISVTVDGMDGANFSAGFFDGLMTEEGGKLEYADGSLSYWISMTESERGWALGRDIHVELKNLCGYEDETGEIALESMVQGTWCFDWNLQGTDEVEEWILEVPVGDSGAVLRRVELSPISGYMECDWPRQRETRQAVGPDGELKEISRWVRAPRMSGVKLKDGTEYKYLFQGDGTEGYLSSDQDAADYYSCRGNERIIDPEQVVSLFFENTADGGFYEVPLMTGP